MGKGCIGGWFCAFAGLCRDLKSESRLFTKTVKNDRDDMVKIYKNRPTQRFSSVENMETSYQCFPADWFHETIDDFCNELGTDFRTADLGRITVHTCVPYPTLMHHSW